MDLEPRAEDGEDDGGGDGVEARGHSPENGVLLLRPVELEPRIKVADGSQI